MDLKVGNLAEKVGNLAEKVGNLAHFTNCAVDYNAIKIHL